MMRYLTINFGFGTEITEVLVTFRKLVLLFHFSTHGDYFEVMFPILKFFDRASVCEFDLFGKMNFFILQNKEVIEVRGISFRM